MKKLLLACTAGMSTRLLIQRLCKEVSDRALPIELEALPLSEALDRAPSADAVLLGPQIGYALGEMERSVHGRIPVDVISMRDYGHLNAKGIIDHAMEMLGLA